MANQQNNTGLTELLLQCMSTPGPMLSMLEWLCAQLMEAEVSSLAGADKNICTLLLARITGVAIAHAGWIPGWARCISWCPSCVDKATSHSLYRNANAVRQH